MVTKVNILIDGGFFTARFKCIHHSNPKVADVQQLVRDVMSKLRQKTANATQDILFRVLYYDCRPFDGKIMNHDRTSEIDYAKSPMFLAQNQFLEKVAKLEQFALRLGELSFTGWKQDIYSHRWKPDFKQKSVDMKFGLDIASMATKHTIDKIVLVAGDSDFIAPIKMARTEGIQIYLYPMGNVLKDALIQHCDYIL